ncbi:MAG: hypothetical protein U1E73_14225 [Planctomycetota bacterium]
MSFDAIVVGSGPAGVMAAKALAGMRTLVVDVGNQAAAAGEGLERNVYEVKASGGDAFAALIGERFESLHNIDRTYLSPKLKAPLVRFVSDGWRQLCPIDVDGFDPVLSLATGGLANVWGAGCYRFLDDDLADFPIRARDLAPHYDEVAAHVGITGTDDDLTRFFGPADGLQPPHRQSRLGGDLARRYARHRAYFHRHGVFVGAPRMAVLSREHRGRPAYDYQGLEFFKTGIRSIYNPAFTLAELVADGGVEYRRGVLVERFAAVADGVVVHGRALADGAAFELRARRLVLAAGAVNSARIALRSLGDPETALPLLDNQISYVPFVNLWHVGRGVEHESLPIQLNVVCVDPAEPCPLQGSFYGVTATLWNDLLFDLPFATRDNIRLLRYLLPAMAVVQMFYPDRARPENRLRLGADGRLRIDYRARDRGAIERRLIRVFRRVGHLSLPSLCKYPDAGNSFHYAGCLPMRSAPGRLQTDASGRLGGEGPVFVADAANFSSLPSKNLTMTIMANALRIGGIVRAELAGS